MSALIPYAANALYPALRNLTRKRLLELGTYAYRRRRRFAVAGRSLVEARKIMNSLRQRGKRGRKITQMRYRNNGAMVRRVPRPIRTMGWENKDIRITRKASLVIGRMQQAVQSTDTQQTFWSFNDISNNALYQSIPLKTVRTYYNDQPFFIDVSKFLNSTAQPLLNQDSTQSAVDIQSITFVMSFINYQPDVDMKLRMMLLRRNELNSRDVNYVQEDNRHLGTSVADPLLWSDFWNDRVDKRDKYDFNHVFSDVDYSCTYKDYSAPNTTIYKIWQQKNLSIRSNPHTHGTKFFQGENQSGADLNQQGTLEQHDPHMDEDIQNEYAPNIVPGMGANITSHDMAVSRIRGYPGQNEKTCIMTWKPKGGYRMQFVKSDTEPEAPILYPKDDLRFLIMPFEQTQDPKRKATQHEIGYRIEMNIRYKDLL